MTTILYVEDNEDNIYMLSRRLRREGFEVSIARTGAEGVAIAHDSLPDLIIMDLVLPEMDGFEAARQLRSADDTSHIPIIALSASVLPEHQHRAIDAGCDDFETKPVEFVRLLMKIEHLLKASP
ncbi:MAG: response regulator [Gammaproteobacteria bacterium]|nr:response regulator [Gammaproteobacteria bacterium]